MLDFLRLNHFLGKPLHLFPGSSRRVLGILLHIPKATGSTGRSQNGFSHSPSYALHWKDFFQPDAVHLPGIALIAGREAVQG